MKNYRNIFPIVCILLVSGIIFSCNTADDKATGPGSSDSITKLIDTAMHDNNMMHDTMPTPIVTAAVATISSTYADTVVNGTATFETTADDKVKMTLAITVPEKANKSVAVHLHEHGDCGDNGKASHGHWNPSNAQHGKWGAGSFHTGDIGNVKLDAKGKGTFTITTDLWTLGGSFNKNIVGKAIIVHSGVDDFTTQPTGNAGNRIGCGLIVAK